MAQLVIKGHKSRGNEVIEILEMLGGTNSESCWGNTILAFPTSEMRDAFKENFDDDIEFCKEFL
jgi:mannose/fructose-specific phosphotransferase system component IIA